MVDTANVRRLAAGIADAARIVAQAKPKRRR